MKKETGLPLFDWQPPKCEFLVFPLVRRVGKIRRVVDVIETKTEKGVESYWKAICQDFNRQCEKMGVSPDVALAELESFKNAVSAEGRRRADRRRAGVRPGGDAA